MTSAGARRAAVTLLDALILVFFVGALVVLYAGGERLRIAGLVITTQTVWRPFAWLASLIVLRLLVDRRTGFFGWSREALRRALGIDERLPMVRIGEMPRSAELAGVAVALAAVLIAVFHQQFADFYRVVDYGDPLFSMWRLAWVAHQVVRDPRHLFDANIFYPEPGTLTYSDAMLLPAFVVAPMIWAGVPIAVVYHLLFFGALLASGLATYALARGIAFSRAAAWMAALLFMLCQYRIEHYSHLELQMTPWMPVSLLAAHRVLATGRRRYVVWLSLVMAAQWYSSMYYGVFLTIYAGVFTAVLAVVWRPGWARFAAGAGALALGIVLALPLAMIYKSTESVRGTRVAEEVGWFSARPIDWLQPHGRSRWYRDVYVVKREEERQLFPNVTPLVLSIAGVAPPLSATRLAVLASGIVAFDGSLGLNGSWYPLAYKYVGPIRSMRVPARLAILVNLTIALLAGFGAARLLGRTKSIGLRRALLAVMSAAVVIEALPNLHLVHLWKEPPPLYASLGDRSGAVLLEYPMHPHAGYFGENIRYMYFSTWHWTRMVNGYSGVVPDSYHRLALASDGFPLGNSVPYLQRIGVTHVTLHCALWETDACEPTADRIAADPRFRLLISTTWQGKPARLYELAR